MTELLECKLYFENMDWAGRHLREIDHVDLLDKFKAVVESYHEHFAPVNYPGALDQFLAEYSKQVKAVRVPHSQEASQPTLEPVPYREAECVKRWPECESGGYDPRCCRFPKSCSCG